ncbi:hypothetical protein [Komagataeibacter oboediens]|uniref:hypothetical protein n=1 Tax=Komagataeibacter oboediens TaxID=65958 RepID=UPI0012F4B0F8|nr:hypothetical protein [Komagataeibacter oboediens]
MNNHSSWPELQPTTDTSVSKLDRIASGETIFATTEPIEELIIPEDEKTNPWTYHQVDEHVPTSLMKQEIYFTAVNQKGRQIYITLSEPYDDDKEPYDDFIIKNEITTLRKNKSQDIPIVSMILKFAIVISITSFLIKKIYDYSLIDPLVSLLICFLSSFLLLVIRLKEKENNNDNNTLSREVTVR